MIKFYNNIAKKDISKQTFFSEMILKYSKKIMQLVWFDCVLWHINSCGLFNAKSCLYIYICVCVCVCVCENKWKSG